MRTNVIDKKLIFTNLLIHKSSINLYVLNDLFQLNFFNNSFWYYFLLKGATTYGKIQ